jgi:uncharacterized protein YdhG (YjbR/CyaY superfamily)
MASTSNDGFSAEERAAMKERAKELRSSEKGAARAAQDAADVLEKIAELADGDRQLAERVHAIVLEAAPSLAPKTWYGMPAYAKDGKIVCFFQGSSKFKSRYSTLGFNDPAQLDDGGMWPTAYAITTISDGDAKRIAELVRKAVA